MPSVDPKAGNRYLTVTGAPVQVLEVRAEIMVLQGLASDTRFVVPVGYPLDASGGKATAFPPRPSPYSPYAKPRRGRPEPKPLAATIDALLLEGERSMQGLVREVNRRASVACRGKDVRANIRARVYWLKKRAHAIPDIRVE